MTSVATPRPGAKHRPKLDRAALTRARTIIDAIARKYSSRVVGQDHVRSSYGQGSWTADQPPSVTLSTRACADQQPLGRRP